MFPAWSCLVELGILEAVFSALRRDQTSSELLMSAVSRRIGTDALVAQLAGKHL